MEATLNLWELIWQGGMAMYPLVLCSVLTLAVIGERAWVLWRVVRPGRRLTAAVLGRVTRRELDEARLVVRTTRTPVAEVLATAVPRGGNGHGTPGGARQAERKRQELLHGLTRHLWLLATVGSLAPFIGLFGTVLGI